MNTAISVEQQDILDQIRSAKLKLESLQKKLDDVNTELGLLTDKDEVFRILNELGDKLDQLHGLGADRMFWGDKFSTEQDAIQHVEMLRSRVRNFNNSSQDVTAKRDSLLREITDVKHDILYFEEELELQKEREERAKHEFIIDRVVEPLPYRAMVMPWASKDEDEKRFKIYALAALLICILLTYLIPMWEVPLPDRARPVEIPERLAKLIKKEEPQPKPKPEPKKQEKTDSKQKPTEKQVQKAREKASNTGLLAFKNNLADLMNDADEVKLGAQAQISTSGAKSKQISRSLVTAQASAGSGGIATSSLSRDVGGTSGKIGAVAFSRVQSEIGSAMAEDRPLSDGDGPTRSDEEIQIIFDRYKASLYRIYNRELRSNPTLQGKMVLRITIGTDGSVISCKVDSTDLASSTLAKSIVERVMTFKFGRKDGSPKITILYPIDFLPAS